MDHGITSARYADLEPQDGYAADAKVVANRNGRQEHRHANDDVEGGGMLAYLAEGGVIDPYVPPNPTVAEVVTERERRLALGFDYDFADARGVHHIATSPSDMVGWDDVTKASQAMIALGLGASTVDIVTDTGPCQVTALEWQQVLIAATQARQPIWAASFALQAMTPIPADFTDDRHWQL